MRFFITERGDLSYQLEAAKARLRTEFQPGDALLAISKNADNAKLREFLVKAKAFTIFHANVTGFGGTKAEPGVSKPSTVLDGIKALIKAGFPAEQIVLRIDPIIPTPKGIETAKTIIEACPSGIKRIRFSLIDCYEWLKPSLPWTSFHAPKENQQAALAMLYSAANGRSLEACGEPGLKENQGCISPKDYQILGLQIPEQTFKGQRKGCLCLGNKTEILVKPKRCPNGCFYCYYRL